MKQEINQYLACEFGIFDSENDLDKITDDWPFQLLEVSSFHYQGNLIHVFSFDDADGKYYAISGKGLNYFPVADFTPEDVKYQIIGSLWVSERVPIDLNTIKGDDPVVPRLTERKRRFEELAEQLRPGVPFIISEGLFLEKSKEYLGLIEFEGENKAQIVGDRITLKNIPYTSASSWRRLSLGIGKLVVKKQLS